jgi:hypothetical protein
VIETTTTYTRTVTCDTCGTQVRTSGSSLQMHQEVPTEWLQVSPPGERVMREFCSRDCFLNYVPPEQQDKPWATVASSDAAQSGEQS